MNAVLPCLALVLFVGAAACEANESPLGFGAKPPSSPQQDVESSDANGCPKASPVVAHECGTPHAHCTYANETVVCDDTRSSQGELEWRWKILNDRADGGAR